MIMEYHLTNARVQLSGLKESFKVGNSSDCLLLFGEVEAIVDYRNLEYITDSNDIHRLTEKALTDYLSTPIQFHQLSVLTGHYVVLQINADNLTRVITSDSLNPKLAMYFRNNEGTLDISNDFRLISSDQNLRNVEVYDPDLLNHFSKKIRGGLPGKTYLKHVQKMDARAIYSVRHEKVKKEAVIYPSDFRENISVEDYLSVIGKKLPEEKFSLAYSSGIDSHVLLEAHQDKIDELCTYYFPYPNLGLEKTKAAGASVIQAIQRGMELPTLISVDECDHSGIDFLQHNASFQIYTSHLALNYYRLAQESKNNHLILGESADAMAGFFTHTNEINAKTMWVDRKRLFWRLLDNLNFRRKLNKKYFEESLEHVLSCYSDEGNLKDTVDLTALSNIWPLLLYFKSSRTIMNSAATIFAAGDYFNKSIHCPYSEPLSHFTVSQWSKSIGSVLDPKVDIRRKYKYISDEEIVGEVYKPVESVEGSIFDTILGDLNKEVPELSKHLKNIGVNKMTSVHIACLALQGS